MRKEEGMVRRVLVLGAGRVAGPCIAHLAKREDVEVHAADRDPSRLEALRFPRVVPRLCGDLSDPGSLVRELRPEVVVNLLPAPTMASVAHACLEARAHMVNASYIKDPLSRLDEAVREAGLLFLCEMGLDPGIDHMAACRTVGEIHRRGGKVAAFWSACGALPDRSSDTNPLGYKLSWSPRDLLGVCRREARFLRDGKETVLPGGEPFRHATLVEVEGLGWFEEYANADSLPYRERYGIPEVRDLYRCTLRYPGWSELVRYLLDLGWFEEGERDLRGRSLWDLTAERVGDAPQEGRKGAAARRLGCPVWAAALAVLEWLGVFSDAPCPLERGSLRDVLERVFLEKLSFLPGEQDLVVLQHRFAVEYPDGRKPETWVSTLVDRGTEGEETSIARTTGLPAAMGTELILEGLALRGVHAPVAPEVFVPALELLAARGLRFLETVLPGRKVPGR